MLSSLQHEVLLRIFEGLIEVHQDIHGISMSPCRPCLWGVTTTDLQKLRLTSKRVRVWVEQLLYRDIGLSAPSCGPGGTLEPWCGGLRS